MLIYPGVGNRRNFFVPQSGIYYPSAISGLKAWYDAADSSTFLQSGGRVSQWYDKSGNNYHAVQPNSGKRPFTGTRTMNGQNVLDFDGIDDDFILPSELYAVPTGNNTVITVIATDAATTIQRLFNGTISTNSKWGLSYYNSTGNLASFNNTINAPVNLAITGNTNPHVDYMIRSGSNLRTGMDGTETNANNAADVTVDKLLIGATGNESSQFFDGKIAEIIVYNAALSNADMNRLGEYFTAKWGISWTNLP